MVRRNKNKIGGKVSVMKMTPSSSQSLKTSVPMAIKNTIKSSSGKTKTSSKMNFYEKYCNNKVQQNLVDAMSILLEKMSNSKNKNEQAFVNSLKKNSDMLPFLTLNKNTNKLSMKMNGGADGDDVPTGNESKCENNNVDSVIRNTPPVNTTGIDAIQQQIARVNQELSSVQPDSERARSLVEQLQTLSMIETMARQRQQAIDIVNRRENWNMAGDVCNRLTQMVFTGLSGYLAYLVLALIKNSGSLITGAASGLLTLFVIIIFDTISKIVNGISGSVPTWLGGGNYMSSGRSIVEDMTFSLNEGIESTPELNNILIQLRDLGYTTNIIAFIILFIIFNIIAHISRIFMTSSQFSIGFTGLSVSQVQRQQQDLPELETPTASSLQQQAVPPSATLENSNQSLTLENEAKEVSGGYKSRKRRRKRKDKKRKSRKQVKQRKTRKGKKSKKKMRKTRKR